MSVPVDPEIIHHLKKDRILVPILENFSPSFDSNPSDVFDELTRSIVSQQLSVKAAATIYSRFLSLFNNNTERRNTLAGFPEETLRSVGLSAQKAKYLKNVALHFDTNQLHHVNWKSWSDDDIINELIQIKGVGKWTIEMILMFSLNRPDVLPLDDLIIRNNIQRLYGVESKNKQLIKDLTTIAESWRPYRSYACLYLWAAKNSAFIP